MEVTLRNSETGERKTGSWSWHWICRDTPTPPHLSLNGRSIFLLHEACAARHWPAKPPGRLLRERGRWREHEGSGCFPGLCGPWVVSEIPLGRTGLRSGHARGRARGMGQQQEAWISVIRKVSSEGAGSSGSETFLQLWHRRDCFSLGRPGCILGYHGEITDDPTQSMLIHILLIACGSYPAKRSRFYFPDPNRPPKLLLLVAIRTAMYKSLIPETGTQVCRLIE